MNKYFIKQLLKVDLPIKFKIKFPDEDDTNVIYIEFRELPESKELTEFYVFIPDNYPLSAPTVINENLPDHPLINNDGEVNMCDWGPFIDIKQLMGNLYCISLEAFERRNKECNINTK